VKRIWSSVFPNLRARRERRLLERTMLETPLPSIPESLRESLIGGIPTCAPADRERTHRRPALAWVASLALTAALWLALSHLGDQRYRQGTAVDSGRVAERRNSQGRDDHSVPSPAPPMPEPRGRQEPRPRIVQHAVRQAKYGLAPRSPRHTAGVREDVALVARTTASRTRETDTGYARVAAWSVDDQGRPVRTEWTIEENSRSRTCRRQVSVQGASGSSQSLVVEAEVRDGG